MEAAPMTLPTSAYRGYAGVSWDTVTVQKILDYLNTGLAPAMDARNDGRYAVSPLRYYVDVENGDGTNVLNAVSNATWTRINAAGTVWANNGGGWDSGNDWYTIPANGTYFCQALVRLQDGIGTSFNFGLGIGLTEGDGSWFQWNKYFTGAGGRCAFDYTRIAGFTAGQQVRLYCFQDSGATQNVTRAAMQIWRMC
jgi:hypothetical protein